MNVADGSDLRLVNVAVDEANRLMDMMDVTTRHSDFAVVASLAYGMLRAIYECPACGPGHYRVPIEREGQEYAVCPDCGQAWVRLPPEQKPKARRKRTKRGG